MTSISERERGEIEAANASGRTPVVFIHEPERPALPHFRPRIPRDAQRQQSGAELPQ